MLDAARFTVPYPEHPHFVGREEDLERLQAALQGEGTVGINPAALGNPTGVTGQGGIGKTQLAVAYAYRYQDEYPDGVYWINAAESLWSEFARLGRDFLGQGDEAALKARLWETLRSRFSIEEARDLCFELGVNYEEFSPQKGISSLARELVEHCARHGQLSLLEGAVRRLRGELAQPQAQDELVLHAFTWLREHPRNLLILDNVADPAALEQPLTRDCIPGRLPGYLLFTTRRRDLGHFRPVELKTLPPDAALRLLLRDPGRVPILDPAHPEHAVAGDICAMFGYLPLAVEIAAAHLAKYPAAPLAVYYQELLRRGALEVMADPHVTVATRHETGLKAALEAQWEMLGEEAQTVLRVAGQLPEAAYLPADRLGLLAGIRDLPADVPEEWRSFFVITLTGALRELQDASLIEELAGDQVRLHPLVREFARDRTPLAEKNAFRAACVRRLLAAVGDIKTLERQVDARGIDAILRDLLAARELLDGLSQEDVLRDLGAYLRVLRREAHNLRGWRQDEAPGFLAQQLNLRAYLLNGTLLSESLSIHSFENHKPRWRLQWAERFDSPWIELTLTGHDSWITSTAIAPNGNVMASGSDDGTIRIWDLDTGVIKRTLVNKSNGVLAVAITSDGRTLVSSSRSGVISIWDVNTGETLHDYPGHGGAAWCIALTPNGRRIVSGGEDGALCIYDLEATVCLHRRSAHEGTVYALALTPDGKRAITGGSDGELKIWNIETGEIEWSKKRHKGPILAVTITLDGRNAISGGYDEELWVWDLETARVIRGLANRNGTALSLTVTPDHRWLIAGDGGGWITFWNLKTWARGRVLAGHYHAVSAIAISSDGKRMISGSRDKNLIIWRLDMNEFEPDRETYGGSVTSLAVSSDGSFCIVGRYNGTILLKALDMGVVLNKLVTNQTAIVSLALTLDNAWVISGSNNWTVEISSIASIKSVGIYVGHTGPVLGIAVVPNSRLAISCSGDKSLSVWNLDNGIRERVLLGHTGSVRSVAVSPDEWIAVSGSEDRTIRLWDLQGNTPARVLIGHEGGVRSVVVTPDGWRVISGGTDQTVRVWKASIGELDKTFTGHRGTVNSVVVTADSLYS